MLQISGTTIRLTRGDTAVIDIALADAAGAPYEPRDGDRLVFGARRTAYSAEYALYKEIAGGRLAFAPQDTAALGCGGYVYDIELTTAAGDVHTVVPGAKLEICPEVVRNG